MPVDTEVWAETVGDVVREFDALLSQIPASGWESPAASVGWSCWRTVEHVCADFAHYAAQIIGQPRDHYVKFSFDTSRATTPGQRWRRRPVMPRATAVPGIRRLAAGLI